MKIWLDGKLEEQEEAKTSVFDHGTLYGDGIFEKFCYLKWILAIRLKLCQFITADFQKLIQILILLFCHFCASLNITLDFQHFVLHDTGWQFHLYHITCTDVYSKSYIARR